MEDCEVRSVQFEMRAAEGGDGLTLEGHAAVFNQWTEIDSLREGNFLERIAPGAFAKTIKERKPVLQFAHGQDTAIGTVPIGAFQTLREDDTGLYVKARLFDNPLTLPVRQAIAGGAIDGMSFRFRVPKDKDTWERVKGDLPRRTVHEAIVYEAGPVVFPAYAGTNVGVRQAALATFRRFSDDDEFRGELVRLLTGTSRAAAEDGTAPVEPPTTIEPPQALVETPKAGMSLAVARAHIEALALRRP